MRPCVYQARHADNLHPFIPLISDAESITPEVLSWIGARPASVMAAVALALSLWTLWRSRSARLQPAPFAHSPRSTRAPSVHSSIWWWVTTVRRRTAICQ